MLRCAVCLLVTIWSVPAGMLFAQQPEDAEDQASGIYFYVGAGRLYGEYEGFVLSGTVQFSPFGERWRMGPRAAYIPSEYIFTEDYRTWMGWTVAGSRKWGPANAGLLLGIGRVAGKKQVRQQFHESVRPYPSVLIEVEWVFREGRSGTAVQPFVLLGRGSMWGCSLSYAFGHS